jgi:hypothetical protein
MKELNRHESWDQGFLERRDRMQLLLLERSEKPIPSTERLGARDIMQGSGEVFRLIESVFGIVPTFLERQEDVRALLTYKPSDPIQTWCPCLPPSSSSPT